MHIPRGVLGASSGRCATHSLLRLMDRGGQVRLAAGGVRGGCWAARSRSARRACAGLALVQPCENRGGEFGDPSCEVEEKENNASVALMRNM
jgi:hypothetical protein